MVQVYGIKKNNNMPNKMHHIKLRTRTKQYKCSNEVLSDVI